MLETTGNYVADRPLPFAMREMQSLLTRRGAWIGVISIGLVLGIAGPFGTEEVLRLAPRLAYWLVVALVTFFSGSFVSYLVEALARSWGLPPWARIALTGGMIGILVTVEILLLNWASFGLSPGHDGYALPLLVNAVAVSLVITVALYFLFNEATGDAGDEGTPAILSRLPLEKRGRLIALSVSDHYVEVITTRGRELVLMRLSDAIRETAPEAGLQVHRSHWVALHGVTAARRDGARAILTLEGGEELPVSRTYLPAAKEAGLLPG